MSILATILLAVAMQGQAETAKQVDTSVYEEVTEGEHSEPHDITEFQFVKASPERVRAYVRQMFDEWDADRSGFVDVSEAPAWLSMGKPSQSDEASEVLEGDAARRRYIANVDKDGDEKVSFEEFAVPVMPQYLERGIPLLPADWKPVGNARDGDG